METTRMHTGRRQTTGQAGTTLRALPTRSPQPHLDGQLRCCCGQELDACRRAFCPRCGHRLACPASGALAA